MLSNVFWVVMHDIFEQLGSLALGSRLRRVSDPLMYATSRLYKSMAIDFEPRWFPVYSALLQSSAPLTIGELADNTGLTQPAVSQVMNQMVQRAWVTDATDPNDARRRLFVLTAKAHQSLAVLQPVWQAVRDAADEMLDELDTPLMPLLSQLEEALQTESFDARIERHVAKKEMAMITIVDYRPELQGYFEKFNREWLEEFFVVEPYDEKVLGDPDTYIIKAGGSIYFAQLNDTIVGTVALIPRDDGVVELSKMGVTKTCQAKGIGRQLAQYCIDQARQQGYHTVMLDSNTKLEPAIKLYRTLGFVEIPTDPHSPYERANIRMVIPFSTQSPWYNKHPKGQAASRPQVMAL